MFKKNISNRAILFFLGMFLFLSFFVFTLWVRADHLRSFDFDTTVRIQAKTPLRLDAFFSFLSVVGRFEYTMTALTILLLFWSKLKAKKLVRVALIIGIFGFAHVLELIGKTILNQPGPPNMFLRSQFSQFPGLYVHTDASYPSGHSLRIIFLGIIYFYFIFKSKLHAVVKISLYIFLGGTIFSMLYSRVSLGEHWTTDIIGGTFLGIGSALISLLLL